MTALIDTRTRSGREISDERRSAPESSDGRAGQGFDLWPPALLALGTITVLNGNYRGSLILLGVGVMLFTARFFRQRSRGGPTPGWKDLVSFDQPTPIWLIFAICGAVVILGAISSSAETGGTL